MQKLNRLAPRSPMRARALQLLGLSLLILGLSITFGGTRGSEVGSGEQPTAVTASDSRAVPPSAAS